MMDKNRDTDEIASFCVEFEKASQNILDSAYRLKAVAGEVEEGLPDELGTLATVRVREFADKIIQLVSEGIEPVDTLKKRNEDMIDEVLTLTRKL